MNFDELFFQPIDIKVNRLPKTMELMNSDELK